MVAAMLEDNLCPPTHFTIENIGKSPTSEAYISKTFHLNDRKFGRKNAIFYFILNVWTYNS